MKKDYGGLAGLVFVVFIAVGLVLMALNSCTTALHAGEASWTLQGEHSHLGCPGQYVETVEVDDQTYFLGCYGSKESK